MVGIPARDEIPVRFLAICTKILGFRHLQAIQLKAQLEGAPRARRAGCPRPAKVEGAVELTERLAERNTA